MCFDYYLHGARFGSVLNQDQKKPATTRVTETQTENNILQPSHSVDEKYGLDPYADQYAFLGDEEFFDKEGREIVDTSGCFPSCFYHTRTSCACGG